MDFEITLHPKQREALGVLGREGVEVLGYGGAKGGGKSYLGRAWLILRSLEHPGTKHLIVRKSFPELERNHIVYLKREIPRGLASYNETKHVWTFRNGSLIELAYVEGLGDLDNYQGAEFDSIFIDEIEQHQKAVFQTLRSCLRTTSKTCRPKMLLTFNPGNVGHAWLKRMFVDRVFEKDERPSQFVFLKALVWDNPSLDEGYISRLEALPEPKRSAYLLGSMDMPEGAFYSGFGTHLEEEAFQIGEEGFGAIYGALDHGTTHNTVYGQSYVDPEGVIHRLFTYSNNGQTTRAHAEEIYQRVKGFRLTGGIFPTVIWYDPSMKTHTRMREDLAWAPIDEYLDVFQREIEAGLVRFEEANNDKMSGCDLCQQLLRAQDGVYKFRYWKGYNRSFAEGVSRVLVDEDNSEIYEKMDGDDEADEWRYEMMGIMGYQTMMKQTEAMKPGKAFAMPHMSEQYNEQLREVQMA